MPSLGWNLKLWDQDYPWSADGDEWTQQAEFCGVPYEKWKDSLARTFLIPHLAEKKVVVEIGPGHGRWSKMIAGRVCGGALYLVDISPSCLEFCQKQIIQYHVAYVLNDGKSLSGTCGNKHHRIDDNYVDFIWSFDTFVHIEEPETRSYIKEFSRVLKRQAMGVIHHSGSPTPEQRANGARSLVTGGLWKNILAENGLVVIRQTDEWGEGCNLKLTGDAITVFVKP
jgi:cyclopropane fatty-acyl-phospholipid synthase-like methyltransferase